LNEASSAFPTSDRLTAASDEVSWWRADASRAISSRPASRPSSSRLGVCAVSLVSRASRRRAAEGPSPARGLNPPCPPEIGIGVVEAASLAELTTLGRGEGRLIERYSESCRNSSAAFCSCRHAVCGSSAAAARRKSSASSVSVLCTSMPRTL